jgi:hypothetical protein
MIEGETTQAMFDRFMTLINRIRALGDMYWDDNSVARKLCRVYRQKNNILSSVIMERPNYDTMSPQEMLAKLKHHECLEHEAKEASSQKKSIALKASHGRNKKKDVHDPSSDEEQEEDSDEEEALLVRNYRKYLKKKKERKRSGGKPYKKMFCYGCREIGHFIADCPKEKKKHKHNKDDDKKHKSKKRGEAHLGEEWESNNESDDSNDKDKEKKKGVATISIQETSSSPCTQAHHQPFLIIITLCRLIFIT